MSSSYYSVDRYKQYRSKANMQYAAAITFTMTTFLIMIIQPFVGLLFALFNIFVWLAAYRNSIKARFMKEVIERRDKILQERQEQLKRLEEQERITSAINTSYRHWSESDTEKWR
jgi:uncharacterized membrane protein